MKQQGLDLLSLGVGPFEKKLTSAMRRQLHDEFEQWLVAQTEERRSRLRSVPWAVRRKYEESDRHQRRRGKHQMQRQLLDFLLTTIPQKIESLELLRLGQRDCYLTDNDRVHGSDQHLFYADVHLHHWTLLGRRLEASTRVRHDIGSGRISGNFMLSWYFDRGRQYRDFHPGTLRFVGLRKQLAEREARPITE